MKYYIQIFSYFVIIGLCLLPAIPALAGTVTGVMQMKDGTPMAGGKVIVFDGDKGPPPHFSDDFREPDFVFDLNIKGVFKIKLNAGKYYFGALQWLDGRGPGKPDKGDHFFLMREPIQVPAEGLVDLGTLARGETIP
jgi:hypothetical protein